MDRRRRSADHDGPAACRAEAAEASGFSSLWVMDHMLQLPPLGGPAASILEGYVALGALAAVTQACRTWHARHRRHLQESRTPRQADRVARCAHRGTHHLGHRAGVVRHRARRYGWDFPPVKERFERLHDAVAICRGCSTTRRSATKRARTTAWPKHVSCRDRSDEFRS